MMRTGIIGRVLRLEEAAPAADNAAFRERLERAWSRIDATLTPDEQAYRQSPTYLAAKLNRQDRIDALNARSARRPTLAERLIAARLVVR